MMKVSSAKTKILIYSSKLILIHHLTTLITNVLCTKIITNLWLTLANGPPYLVMLASVVNALRQEARLTNTKCVKTASCVQPGRACWPRKPKYTVWMAISNTTRRTRPVSLSLRMPALSTRTGNTSNLTMKVVFLLLKISKV